jgi:hypothetical protein
MGDHSATGAFSEAIRIVTENPVSVLGYSILRVAVAIAAYALIVIAALMGGLVAEELGLLLAVGVGLLVGPISASVFYAHHAHYYRRIQ